MLSCLIYHQIRLRSFLRMFSYLTNLAVLNLTNNTLLIIPASLALCRRLRVLHLNNNGLINISSEIVAKTNLQDLQLLDNDPQLLATISKSKILKKAILNREAAHTISYGNPLQTNNVPIDVRREIYQYIPCADLLPDAL